MDDPDPFRSMSIGHPIPEIKQVQTLTLKLQGQGHGCGQRARSYNRPSIIHINSFPFHFTSIRPTIPEIELFRNLTLKHPRSRLWVRSKVKVTYCTQYPTNALPFRFTSIGPTIPEIWPKYSLTLDVSRRWGPPFRIWPNDMGTAASDACTGG